MNRGFLISTSQHCPTSGDLSPVVVGMKRTQKSILCSRERIPQLAGEAIRAVVRSTMDTSEVNATYSPFHSADSTTLFNVHQSNDLSQSLGNNLRAIQRPIEWIVDLCLFRLATDRLAGRILPYAIRQMIKDYAFIRFTDEGLQEAVRLWCTDRQRAYQLYGDINDWDVSEVTTMAGLFKETDFNDAIDRWNVHRVTCMDSMFLKATAFNQPLDAWDVSCVTSMSSMFRGATSFNQPLASWDVHHVVNMGFLFHGASSFNQPLHTWDVSQVASMRSLFHKATMFHQPLASWDVSQVTNMMCMFYQAAAFNQPVSSWNVSQVSSMKSMFCKATSFNQRLDTWDTRQVTDMTWMLDGAIAYNQPSVVRPSLDSMAPQLNHGVEHR